MARVKPKRRYDSALRRRQANETKTRILDTAQRLFSDRGYAPTTIEALASEAGVATDTVYAAFRSKRGVLRGLLNVRVFGEDSPGPLKDLPGPKSVRAQPTQRRQIAAFAADIAGAGDRARPVQEIFRSAAAVDPEVAALWVRMQQARYDNLREFASWIAAKGPFRGGMDLDEATAIVWTLASPEVNGLLRRDRGWSQERYVAWLTETLVRTLLAG